MGRKKPSGRDDDSTSPAVTGKSKKKGVLIDDDEYSVGTQLSEDPPAEEEKVVITGKKKSKKGSSKEHQVKDETEDAVDDDEDVAPIAFTGKKKGKSKKGVMAGSGFGMIGEDGEDGDGKNRESDGEESAVINFGGKKKSSKKSNKGGGIAFASSGFAALDEEDEVDQDEEVSVDNEGEAVHVVAVNGEKKSSKGTKKGGAAGSSPSAFDALDEDDGVDEGAVIDDEDADAPVLAFTGKKKPSKSSKNVRVTAFSSFDALGVEEEEQEKIEDEEDEASAIAFSGKKKKSSKASKKTAGNSSSTTAAVFDEGDAKESSAAEATSVSHDTVDNNKAKKEDVTEISKNKKKNKKKSGRTAQEEDDLDKLLAELGEGSIVSKPPEPQPQEEKVGPSPEPVAHIEQAAEKEGAELVESAAAKRNRKKKEKEKEKKAAAAAKKDAKNEVIETEAAEPKKNDKKVPKAVREMQEAMARLKEREEKMKREEEERLRKEEEERLMQEELARQAEEAKRKKKEREKEKLLKKKQEGKLLTAKQKDEARRLAAFREQLLANAAAEGLPVGGDTGSGPPKRPKYQTKKSKPGQHQANGGGAAKEVHGSVTREIQQETISEADSLEPEKGEEVEVVNDDNKYQTADADKENGVEEEDVDDEEWDAKSWDDVNLSVKSSFVEEEADSEPDAAKEIKSVSPPSHRAGVPSTDEKSTSVSSSGTVKSKGAKAEPSAVPKSTEPDLRSPICCIMGHVDTGKTKLLDCIRGTNVQEGEAGGITQQIGATYFPADNIRERTRELKEDATLKVPGLLVIDTPGHESFTNLRSRGSGLCDIAILVVDIMHGLEPQTIESLNLLKMRNTEFIVALNKVDRLYGWKTCKNAPIIKAMKQQSKDVQNEFNMRLIQIITQLKEQGLNTELYYKNKDRGETYNIVPTSAISGEGIPDLLLLLVQWTQKTMVEKLTFRDELECTVLEVKVIEGHGTTIDVVLVNGVLHEGDQIVVCGLQGPIVTTIRALLTPHPMKELRVKGTYLHHKEIKAAQGIKITAQGLEHAIAGTGLYVVGPDDELDDVTESAMEDMKNVMSRIDKTGEGVYVQASTLGSLEALLEFLKSPAVTIPVSGIGIGPVHKKDVMKSSVMLEKKKEYATILAFDVKVTPEARELADELGVKIFIADIIYHLFDQFKAYIDNIKEEKKREAADEAVFPCVLQILPNCVFNKKDPIVLGVDIVEGIAKVGTPICIPQREFIDIGRIASIENNHKPVDTAKKGQKVAIKIVGSNSEEQQKMFGRHFEIEDQLVSHISRKSIDILKTNYRDDLSIEDWKLVVKLKNLFKIQ